MSDCMFTFIFREMTNLGEPAVKRRKRLMKVHGDSISLTHYCSGRHWHGVHENRSRTTWAIENRLYFIAGERSETKLGEIEVSDDFGKTWHEYSRLPLSMEVSAVLPVYAKSGTIVCLFLNEYKPEDPFWLKQIQVWVSRDLLRTFHLVCANPEFGAVRGLYCFPNEDGALCAHVFSWTSEMQYAWLSRDMGVTWQLESPEPMESYPGITNSLVYHRGRLYRLGHRKLIYSDNGGKSWATAELPFIPLLMIKDYWLDRIVCFSPSDCFELMGEATNWRRVAGDWKKVIVSMIAGGAKRIMLAEAMVMRDGAMLLTAYLNTSRVLNVVSYPESERAQRDKNRLAFYLSAKGIYSPLFQAHIAPFLFPY